MSASAQLKINEPIRPGQGLGGLRLRTEIGDYQDLILEKVSDETCTCELIRPFEARYAFEQGVIQVAVDVRNSKIFKLIAGHGYEGLLFGKIKVGMTVAEAMSLDSDLYYDEVEEAVLHRRPEGRGVVIDVPEIDPPPHMVPGLRISHISIHIEELTEPQAQRGSW